jgi:hypothetical protein
MQFRRTKKDHFPSCLTISPSMDVVSEKMFHLSRRSLTFIATESRGTRSNVTDHIRVITLI